MKLAVLGATGKAGKAFVSLAIQRNHRLKILVRSPRKVNPEWKVKVIVGDACNETSINTLVTEVDAVVSLLGHSAKSPKNIQSQAIKHLINRMNQGEVKRLVSLTGSAVPGPQDKLVPHHWLTNQLVSLIDPARVSDGRKHAQLIQASQLDWTIVRTPIQIRHSFGLPLLIGNVNWHTGLTVERQMLVQFIL